MNLRLIRSTQTFLTAAALLLAGCAAPPLQVAETPKAGAAIDAIGYDATSKQRAPREGKKRDRAGISADFNLGMEANQNGPPSAAQLFRAMDQRNAILRERDERQGVSAKLGGVTSANWQALGPGNVGGRVRAIAFDPRNASRIFVGAASGGIWLSEDAGNSWRPINDFLGNLSITSIVFDSANPNTMYAATGEVSAGLVGVGVFKSTDAGLNWTWLATTSPDLDQDWRFVNRLAIHPQQSNVLLAGTTNGSNSTRGAIFRTVNGGATWSKVANVETLDIAFDPNNPNNAVAGRDDGFISYSRDAGQTWQSTTQLITEFTGRPSNSTARVELAFARSRPGLIYASIDHAKGEVWKSEDSGATWNLLVTTEHLNGQGEYDNTIWVDPTNENNVMIGGLDLHRSTDGGLTFTKVSDWRAAPFSAHADQHAIVSPPNFSANNPMVYFGNDGGLYRAGNFLGLNSGSDSNSNGWTNLNRGLAVTQFYAGAGKRAAGGRIIGGTQDNGSLQLENGGQWSMWRGGDGGFSAVDPQDDRIFYGEYVYLSVHRSLNGGINSGYICNGITEGKKSEGSSVYCGADATEKTNFISPFMLDPNNSSRLLGGANSLWVTDNAKDAVPTWRTIKPPYTGAQADNYINAIAVSQGNSAVIWVGHNFGQVFKTTDGLSGAPTWSLMPGLPANRRVQSIMIDSADPNHVIVAYTGFNPQNLWETRNGGNSWSSAITANLPDAPIFSVVRHPTNANWLYVGTSVGVFASENGGQSWSTTNDGPANVRVRDLFWYSNTELVAATYGRGMFKATVGGGAANYQDVWWGGPTQNGWGLNIAQHGNTLVGGWYVFGADNQPMYLIMQGGTWDAGFTTFTGPLIQPVSGAPFSNYDPALFVPGPTVGTMRLTFSDVNNATMNYTVNGVSGTKTLSRLQYGGGTATANYADVWSGGASQNGWGIAIAQQGATLVAGWYTFGTNGKPVWFVLNGGTWLNATTYRGPLITGTGAPVIGTNYNANAFAARNVGELTLVFSDLNNATMTYTVDGVTQTKQLTRLAF